MAVDRFHTAGAFQNHFNFKKGSLIKALDSFTSHHTQMPCVNLSSNCVIFIKNNVKKCRLPVLGQP